MSASSTAITVTFYFETSRAEGTPEEVLTRMCHEQTTSGYDTLAGRAAAAPRLAPYQASVQKLRLMPSTDEVDCGFAEVDFPWESMSQTGNPLEDALCFVMGESSHVKGMLKLRMVDLTFPDHMMRDSFGSPSWCSGSPRNSGRPQSAAADGSDAPRGWPGTGGIRQDHL